MYITLKSIKKDYGFKGIEINDILIALPMLILFVILFCFTNLKLLSLELLLVCTFCLIPINVSKKNRMYKVLILMIRYIFRIKTFVYISERK